MVGAPPSPGGAASKDSVAPAAASAPATGNAPASADPTQAVTLPATPAQAGSEPVDAPLKAKPVAGKPKQLLVTLILNGEDQGLRFALRDGDRLLLDAKAIESLQTTPSTLGTQTFRNRDYVDPAIRFPGATVVLNDSEDKLTLTLPGNAFQKQVIRLNQLAPIVPLTSSPSAFLNYSLGASDQRVGSAYFDMGISKGTGIFRTSLSGGSLVKWQRGLTSYQQDDPAHLRRWTVGDQFVFSSDGLGGGASIAGVGLVRAFDLDPYLITLPQPSLSGVLQAPGTIDVYRNGVLVAQRQVNAGPFSLEQLGVGVGQNNVRVVIHDPFGGTRELSQSFYAVNNNLAKGLSEYAYQVGINSPQPGQTYQSNKPVLLARERWGLSDSWTVGYRVEAETHLTNAGLNADVRLPFGGLHVAAGASQSAGNRGTGATFNYSVSGARWSTAIGASQFSSGYRRLGDAAIEDLLRQVSRQPTYYPGFGLGDPTLGGNGLPGNGVPGGPTNPFFNPNDPLINPISPAQDLATSIAATRLLHQVYGTVGYSPFRRLLLQATYTRSKYADGRTDHVQSIGANLDLSWASIYAGYDNSKVQGQADKTISLNVTIPLGAQTVTLSRIARKDGTTTAADFQRSLPSDTGYGYSLHAEQGEQGTTESGNFSAQNRVMRFNAQAYNTAFGRSADAQVAGSVVFIGSELHFGRPLTSGYALVHVGDGLAGVPVIRENQEVGQTGKSGSFLVNDLLPFQNNQIAFDQKGVPAAYTMTTTERLVNVPRFGGTVVNFHVRPMRSIRGIFKVDDVPLAGAAITHVEVNDPKRKDESRDLEAPMGAKGNFYLEDVPAGHYDFTVLYQGRLAQCPVIVPANDTPVYNLKTVNCAWTGVPPEAAKVPTASTPGAEPSTATTDTTPAQEASAKAASDKAKATASPAPATTAPAPAAPLPPPSAPTLPSVPAAAASTATPPPLH
jgi:outer membrane usher protein